ncbi:uncharacterized protein LOC126672228 [Mercurialis annua]|uniref:uncharacterized protein LOC126672228 n=1 Tax=Mercurialis annua TaxID=3986 RepID=UPI00215F7B87|nr:uncharacterized protein LOC126672228 [Mercurialis annua]
MPLKTIFRKWVSKVLAERLSSFLPLIVSESQFGFVKGRNIHDCHMIASEIIHLVHSRREKVIMVKLDFKKAFDSVSWSFIISMLKRMNFDEVWINWISSLFKSSQLSVLINGSPTENFFMEKGVRQGDPISPLLFVLAVEGMRAIFDEAISLGLIDGIQIDGYRKPVLLFQFADDTLKSSVTGINLDDHSMGLAAEILTCKIDSFPITYLGLPLSLKKPTAKQWDPIVQNFSSQLSSWRGSLLSPAAPVSVLNSLEKYMRNFLWNGSINGNYFSKVAWRDVCSPFLDGGLNIIPLRLKNRCLLFKWIWKLMNANYNSLWFLVVNSSCAFKFWFELFSGNTARYSHLWRGIINCCLSNEDSWNIFYSNISFSLGIGNRLRFWHDKWIGEDRLSSSFPRLFKVSRSPNIMVVQVFENDQFDRSSLIWKRSLRLGEKEDLNQLQLLMETVTINNLQQDVFSG